MQPLFSWIYLHVLSCACVEVILPHARDLDSQWCPCLIAYTACTYHNRKGYVCFLQVYSPQLFRYISVTLPSAHSECLCVSAKHRSCACVCVFLIVFQCVFNSVFSYFFQQFRHHYFSCMYVTP
jgi:hypothetical protein